MVDKVMIDGLEYAIVPTKDLHAVDENGRKEYISGHIIFSELAIKLHEDLPESLRPTAVMHEAIHGILYHAGQTEQVEAHVIALGYGMVAFMRENPAFVREVMGWTGGVS